MVGQTNIQSTSILSDVCMYWGVRNDICYDSLVLDFYFFLEQLIEGAAPTIERKQNKIQQEFFLIKADLLKKGKKLFKERKETR